MYVDVHQHLWPEQFVDALRRRPAPPRLDGWTLYLDGEPPYEVRPADHDPARRAVLDSDASRVLVSLSSPLGIERLAPREAEPLLRAWHDGVRDLPAPFAGWASLNHVDPDLDGLAKLLADGFAGVQVPATELATAQAVESAARVLRVAEAAGRPVLVHPGPATGGAANPAWWAAVVDYPAQLHAAWWAWQAAGRALLPQLRICFAAGAALAPVHHERATARGGPAGPVDPRVFVDTSSYGRQGFDALARALGIDALVLGSDRPYASPPALDRFGLGDAAMHAVRATNPQRLLGELE